jgi:hypothetical protein
MRLCHRFAGCDAEFPGEWSRSVVCPGGLLVILTKWQWMPTADLVSTDLESIALAGDMR